MCKLVQQFSHHFDWHNMKTIAMYKNFSIILQHYSQFLGLWFQWKKKNGKISCHGPTSRRYLLGSIQPTSFELGSNGMQNIAQRKLLVNSYTSFMMAHKSCRSQKSPTLIHNKFEKCSFPFAQVSSTIKYRNLYSNSEMGSDKLKKNFDYTLNQKIIC